MSSGNLDSADLKAVAAGGAINEDVMQRIIDITNIPLPFTDMVSNNEKADNSYTEWTIRELAAVDVNNAIVDGADAGTDDSQTGLRVGNHCQQSEKVVKVSERAQRSNTIGASNELAIQVMDRSKELRRDVEAIALTQQASVADDGNTTPGKAGGVFAWLETNTDRGGTGADGGFNTGTKIVDAPTPGTARAISEASLKDLLELIYNENGNATKLMTRPKAKRKISEYMYGASANIASLSSDVGQQQKHSVAIGAVDVWVTDFQTLELIPNRLQQQETGSRTNIGIFDPEYVDLAYLIPYRVAPLAKTGAADNRQMLVDWTVKMLNEKAHGVYADVNETLAMTA